MAADSYDPPGADRGVWLIGPESTVYHATLTCAVLRETYWPVHQYLKPDGSVHVHSLASPVYDGRTPCRRCHAR